MKKRNSHAFTLVEMMIVIVLLLMLLTFAYLPYAHYQEKLKIRQALREASQTILWSRNLAINGYDENISWDFQNRWLWVYFSNKTNEDHLTRIYTYNKDHPTITTLAEAQVNALPEKKLPTGTLFEWVMERDSLNPGGFTEVTDAEGVIFYYHPITGESEYYTVNDIGVLTPIDEDQIFLEFSYKNSTSPVLRKVLQYDTRAHIIDYGKWVTEL